MDDSPVFCDMNLIQYGHVGSCIESKCGMRRIRQCKNTKTRLSGKETRNIGSLIQRIATFRTANSTICQINWTIGIDIIRCIDRTYKIQITVFVVIVRLSLIELDSKHLLLFFPVNISLVFSSSQK